ncbi:MAG: alpha/beta hydrolase [Acidimicrobiia bacterium]|nr:alpha/beta hydrolase [Acidimicrobiia bacterium]
MPLDPASQMVLELMSEVGVVLDVTKSVDEMRAMLAPDPEAELPPVGGVQDQVIPGPDGDIAVRIFHPVGSDDADPLPVVVFFHGGGWVIGSVESHEVPVREMVNLTGAIYVSVEYRLAPEHPFPAAVEDCYAATVWVAESAASFGGDASRLVVAGDSAGGNLATVTAALCRDRGGPDLAFQLLVYPCVDADPAAWSSMEENADGYFLTRDSMTWFYDHYLGADNRTNPLAAPIHGDLRGLPPAFIITAQFDPLRDEGEAYADKLRAAGVACANTRYDGVFHTFFGMAAAIPTAAVAQADAAAAVRAAVDL